jgi:hypothetical protein
VPFGADAERDDVGALGDLQTVEHHHRQAHVIKPPRHQLSQRGTGPLDKHLRDRALGRRRGRLLDIGADGLAGPRESAGGDAGEHPIHHRPGERVAIGEVLLCRDR